MKKKILETERLVLESVDESHVNDLFALLSNTKVHRYFPGALNEEESARFYERIQRNYAEDGYSFWAVIRKSDLVFIGICGLLKQSVDDREETEVGYRILDAYWGNGYGTEAARGCMEYAKAKLGKTSVVSLIKKINKQSIRVAEKNGLRYEKDIVFNGSLHGVYRSELVS